VFSPNHQRYLFSRFHYIDETLGEAVQALQPTDEGRLFKPLIPDATAAQRKVLADYLAQLRFALRTFIDAQQLEDIPRSVSGLWSVRTAVIFAQNAVTELRPTYMQGYGPLDTDAVVASERLVAELTTLLKRIGAYLDKGEQGDLASRLAQLDATREETLLLKELERIISEQGLVELRVPLESLIARATTPRYEIAVFGRVNSGKSSLLNWWLGQPVLPTGVTPVTAVPTRIVHGQTANAQVRIASSPVRDVSVEELPSYVTEAGNPGNTKRVLEVVVEIPSERLRQGICLVDTPGLGSIASAGAAQTLEYLPRCDLGIQLIEAAGALTREDLAVARAILDGGSDLLIVLSKADRLSSAELAQAESYIAQSFSEALGVAVSVRPISTLKTHVALASDWFTKEVAPRLTSYRENAAVLLKRKVGVLCETVSAILSVRLNVGSDPPLDRPGARAGNEEVAQIRADIERSRSELLTSTERVRDCTSWLAAGVAQELAKLWLEDRASHSAAAAALRSAIARRAAEIGDVIAGGLRECAGRLQQVLAKRPPDMQTAEEFPQPRGRPIYDSDSIPLLATYARPWWTFGLRRLLLSAARGRIDVRTRAALREQLSVYSTALHLWGVRYLDELARHLENAWAGQEGAHRFRSISPLGVDAARAMQRDLTLLQRWPAREAQSHDSPTSSGS